MARRIRGNDAGLTRLAARRRWHSSPAASRCSPWRRFSSGRCCSLTLPGAGLADRRSATRAPALASFWQRARVRAAAAGWWFGFGYFLFGLFWIGEAFLVEADKFAWLLPFAVTLLPAGLALFWRSPPPRRGSSGRRASPASSSWRSRCRWRNGCAATCSPGFPWNMLGYALTSPLALMQAASLFGIYGLTLLAVVIFALRSCVAAAASGARRASTVAWRGAAIAIVPLSLALRLRRLAALGRPARLGRRRAHPHRAGERAQRDKWRAGEAGRDLPGSARSVAPRRVRAPRRSRRHHASRLAGGGDAVSAARAPGGAGRDRRASAAGHAAHLRGAAAEASRAARSVPTPRGLQQPDGVRATTGSSRRSTTRSISFRSASTCPSRPRSRRSGSSSSRAGAADFRWDLRRARC